MISQQTRQPINPNYNSFGQTKEGLKHI